MSIVSERIDALPFDTQPVMTVQRNEALLLAEALATPGARPREYAPVEVVHLGATYVDRPFSPPKGVFESPDLRIEWQDMNGRQPFYHRNCGADELSFQVCGERTLITELGSVELRPGDFSRIPDGTAHDNFGRRDVHLLFYIPSPVQELLPAAGCSEYKAEPFPGWSANVMNELTTEGVAGPGQDVMLAPMDEQLLIDTARQQQERIAVLRPSGESAGVQWLYRSDAVWIGRSAAIADDGRCYTRHRNAEEIQYQVSGERTLVTQRGVVHLVAGDFVRIPRGVAFTSVHAGHSEHLVIASAKTVPQVTPCTRQATRASLEHIESLRQAQ